MSITDGNKVIKVDFDKVREGAEKFSKKKSKTELINEERQQEIEEEITRINKRYLKLEKSVKDAKSDVQVNVKILKYCLNMSMHLLPTAQEIYTRYRSERAMYALNALVNQTRDLMDDIRQLSSNDKTVDHMLNSIMLPNLQLILQHTTNEFAELKTILSDAMPAKKAKMLRATMSKMQKNQAKLLTDIGKMTEEKIREYFK